jgi:hypothetical protein
MQLPQTPPLHEFPNKHIIDNVIALVDSLDIVPLTLSRWTGEMEKEWQNKYHLSPPSPFQVPTAYR